MNICITQSTQNDKQISKSISSFYKVSHFFSPKGIQCIQKKEDSDNRNLSISLSAVFFYQKHIYESTYKMQYS